MIGQRFSRWLVTGAAVRRGTRTLLPARCDCGTEREVDAHNLTHGWSRSCGCLQREVAARTAAGKATHGMYGTPTYRSWKAMVQRCTLVTSNSYAGYGAKGITVDPRWLAFEAFLADMGERPAGTSLDRWPNPTGNYEPGNCRWATPTEQSRNKSSGLLLVTARGETKCVAEWCSIQGLPQSRVYMRIRSGMDPVRALQL